MLAPPGSEQAATRTAIQVEISAHIEETRSKIPEIAVFVAGDFNSVMDKQLDRFNQSASEESASMIKFFINKEAMQDVLRIIHPHEIAYTRVEVKIHGLQVHTEGSRIDAILGDAQALNNHTPCGAYVVTESPFLTDHRPMMAAFSTRPHQVRCIGLQPMREPIPGWQPHVRRCQEHDTCIRKAQNEDVKALLISTHPERKHDKILLSQESKWLEIESALKSILDGIDGEK